VKTAQQGYEFERVDGTFTNDTDYATSFVPEQKRRVTNFESMKRYWEDKARISRFGLERAERELAMLAVECSGQLTLDFPDI
jgi:hypothetical protein